MENEILEELWKAKEQVAAEFEYDIDKLITCLKDKQKSQKADVVDLSKENKKAA